ncbi:MAG TPA: hypothetical protein VFY05_04690 [Candidatus Angelobacter sp.]|nr:hypothetical protein [Candidatus Angelobacter sp.]
MAVAQWHVLAVLEHGGAFYLVGKAAENTRDFDLWRGLESGGVAG